MGLAARRKARRGARGRAGREISRMMNGGVIAVQPMVTTPAVEAVSVGVAAVGNLIDGLVARKGGS